MSIEKKETKLEDKSTRVKRSRLRNKGKMYVNDKHLEKGFHYRFVNDIGGNVQSRIEMGYEVVQDSTVTVGEGMNESSSMGSVVSKTVSSTGQKAVLMRIPNEDYKEILDELEDENKRVDDTILNRAGINKKDVYGSVTRKDINK